MGLERIFRKYGSPEGKRSKEKEYGKEKGKEKNRKEKRKGNEEKVKEEWKRRKEKKKIKEERKRRKKRNKEKKRKAGSKRRKEKEGGVKRKRRKKGKEGRLATLANDGDVGVESAVAPQLVDVESLHSLFHAVFRLEGGLAPILVHRPQILHQNELHFALQRQTII